MMKTLPTLLCIAVALTSMAVCRTTNGQENGQENGQANGQAKVTADQVVADLPPDAWPNLCRDWMRSQGWLKQ